jgi:hypothetical protein
MQTLTWKSDEQWNKSSRSSINFLVFQVTCDTLTEWRTLSILKMGEEGIVCQLPLGVEFKDDIFDML